MMLNLRIRDEFEELFAPYGNVEHSVIMATLDQFNRRRGFVVLSTHQEACVAIRALSGIQLQCVSISGCIARC